MSHRSSLSIVAIVLTCLTVASSAFATTATSPNTAIAEAPSGTPFRGDAARTGTMPGPGIAAEPGYLWRYLGGPYADDEAPVAPGVGDGVLVVTRSDTMIALDVDSGEELWSLPFPGSLSASLIADGVVYAGSRGAGVKALDVSSGAELWTFRTGAVAINPDIPADLIASSPVLVDGTLFIGGGFYGGLFALDAKTGKEVWRFETRGEVWSSPAVADGVVYVTTNSVWDAYPDDPAPSALYAVDSGTGQLIWTFALGSGDVSFSTPMVGTGLVVFGASNADLDSGVYYAIDSSTGLERWRIETEHPMWGRSPGSNGELIFLAEENANGGDRLAAVQLTDGATAWSVDSFAGRLNWVANTGSILYFKDGDDNFYALDATTGKQLWQLPLGAGGGEPVVVDSRIYVIGEPLVYALSADGGRLATSPIPPTSGPGSTAIETVGSRSTHYGIEPGGYWIWEPADPTAEPLPVIMYLSGCCGDEGWPSPEEVDPWLSHLARQGYIVIAPVYDPASPLEHIKSQLQNALNELAKPEHSRPDLSRFAIAAYSYGGVPAVRYSATAAEAGLPIPRAIFAASPCSVEGLESCPETKMEGMTLPAGMKAVVLAFSDDEWLGVDGPRAFYGMLAALPPEDRDFVAMFSDIYGQPVIYADHFTPTTNQDAADWYGIWKLSDSLFACEFEGTWCEYALGDTPEQRFMGEWSDRRPVAELVVNGIEETTPNDTRQTGGVREYDRPKCCTG